MTTITHDLPPQGDRTPKGRREGGTVPAPLSSSSSDGLPGVSVTSTPGKPAIVTGADAPVPCGEDLWSLEDWRNECLSLREDISFCKRDALRASRLLLGWDYAGRLSLLKRIRAAIGVLVGTHNDIDLVDAAKLLSNRRAEVQTEMSSSASVGVQAGEALPVPLLSGGGSDISRSGGGAASKVWAFPQEGHCAGFFLPFRGEEIIRWEPEAGGQVLTDDPFRGSAFPSGGEGC